jgi:hypothetical protein
MNERRHMGLEKKGVLFPVAPPTSEMSGSYNVMLDSIIEQIKESHVRLVLEANVGMIMLYWNIGNEILERQESEGWGAKVIDRLSKDLTDSCSMLSRTVRIRSGVLEFLTNQTG